MHGHVCVSTHICAHVYVEARGQLGCKEPSTFHFVSPCFTGTQNLPIRLRWLGSQPGFFGLCLFSAGITRMGHHIYLFYVGAGD